MISPTLCLGICHGHERQSFVQPLGQLELATELLPLMVAVPSAAARCTAQAHIWSALVDLDLATRAARRAGERGPPASELKNTLTDTFVLKTIAAKENGNSVLRLASKAVFHSSTSTSLESKSRDGSLLRSARHEVPAWQLMI